MKPPKLTPEDVRLIRQLYEPVPPRLSIREIAQKFGVSQTTIWNVVNGYSHFRRGKP